MFSEYKITTVRELHHIPGPVAEQPINSCHLDGLFGVALPTGIALLNRFALRPQVWLT